MPRFPTAPMCVLLAVLGVTPLGAVPPPGPATRALPDGALMGLAEDAADLARSVAATTNPDMQAAPAEVDADPDDELLDDGSAEGTDAGASPPRSEPQADTDDAHGLDDGAVPPVGRQPGLLVGPVSAARQVLVPVRLDLPFIERVLAEQVLDETGVARFDMDEAGCNTLSLSQPAVRYSPVSASEPAGIRVRMLAHARFGLSAFGGCTQVADWDGQVELLQTPHVLAGGGGFGLGVATSRVLDASGDTSAAGLVWNWVKSRVQPRLGAVSIDLRGPLGELRGMLSQMLVRQTAEGLASVLESVRVTDATAVPTGVTVTLRLPAPAALATPPPAPLNAEELARFRAAVSDLDGFFTFVTRTVAGPALGERQRDALLAALLDGRYRLQEAIATGEHGDMAVRALFVELWSGLAPVLAGLPGELPAEQGLRYLAFIAAGDALRAVQELGPGTGLDISGDGLRRLARLIAPGVEDDPLRADDAVDEDLRRRFGFGAPLPPPALRPAPEAEPGAWLRPLEWLLPSARADSAAALDRLGASLDGWAPETRELDRYLPLVRDLLDAVVTAEYEAGKLPEQVRGVYRALVLATAWQESCWRQFVRKAGVVTTLRSTAGALGLMQVSRQVWRGFYDVAGLEHDIAYNARAGAEIARHYLVDYALPAGEQQHEGGLDNLARATYAAYNGGPRQLGRYRNSDAPARLRAIDKAFLAKFQTVRAGDELAVASCFGAG